MRIIVPLHSSERRRQQVQVKDRHALPGGTAHGTFPDGIYNKDRITAEFRQVSSRPTATKKARFQSFAMRAVSTPITRRCSLKSTTRSDLPLCACGVCMTLGRRLTMVKGYLVRFQTRAWSEWRTRPIGSHTTHRKSSPRKLPSFLKHEAAWTRSESLS